ncbi:MAG TPA: GDSL-type esterase/lipase family protein [Bacteroidota bacterium]|nr:GDSL-type esterase/lipase family protein [Bacteroidota bacterium]
MMKKLIAVCCCVLITSTAVMAQGYDTLYRANKTYTVQTGLHRLYSMQRAAIVMLGNSITYGVNWGELLGRHTIANRGIGGDNTYGILNRMSNVYSLQPKICFIMAGINDLYAGIPVDTIFANYKKIIFGLRDNHIVPVIEATLHVNEKFKRADEINPLVAKLNTMLQKFADDQKLDFLNLNRLIAPENKLRDDCTFDGIHLTAAGYGPWRAELEPILKKYGL